MHPSPLTAFWMLGISQLNCVFAQKYITLILKCPSLSVTLLNTAGLWRLTAWQVRTTCSKGKNQVRRFQCCTPPPQRQRQVLPPPPPPPPGAATSTTATAPGAATSTTVKAPGAATSTTATAPDVPWVWPGCLWRRHAWPPGWAAPCAADPAAPPAAPACGTACRWSSLSCLMSPPAAAASRLQGCPKDLGKGQPGTNFNGHVARRGVGSRPFCFRSGVMCTSTLYLGRALEIPSSLNPLKLHWYTCRFYRKTSWDTWFKSDSLPPFFSP